MPIPTPTQSESENEFISRCMSDEKMKTEYQDEAQRYAVCASQFAGEKISFDYDGTISTANGEILAAEWIKRGATVYIISARSGKVGMMAKADKLVIPESRVYATGSNKAKVEKVLELGVIKHYDNNNNVVNSLPGIGVLYGTK